MFVSLTTPTFLYMVSQLYYTMKKSMKHRHTFVYLLTSGYKVV